MTYFFPICTYSAIILIGKINYCDMRTRIMKIIQTALYHNSWHINIIMIYVCHVTYANEMFNVPIIYYQFN